MDNNKNPFRTKNKEEVAREALEAKRIADSISKTVQDAAACLNSSVFLKYKESVKKSREALIKIMQKSSEPDPVKFAFLCKACLSKIDALDMILDEVEHDSKKGVLK